MLRNRDALKHVDREIERARRLFPGQESGVPMTGWLAILTEEVGEVAHELNELELGNVDLPTFFDRIRTELTQVAAMAVLMASACELQVKVREAALR